MTIRVLHTEWSNGYGGQEIRILSEIQVMRSLGVKCALACRENAQILSKAQSLGIETFTLPFKRKTDTLSIWCLKQLLKDYDILNTHSGIDTWCGGLASIGSGKKFIRTRHLSTPIHPSRLNFINAIADFIITTGESIRMTMIRDNHIKPEKIASVPTGIDIGIFQKSLYDKERLKEIYKIPKDKIVIGNLGIMRHAKRQDIFIQVAKIIHKKYPNTYFIIGGSGDGFAWLESLIKDGEAQEYIKLLGYVEKPAEFLSMLDIFMLTSEKEGVPQSLMQALLMEIPSIASDVGSIKDLYHNKNFILTSKPSLEEFLVALEKILENPSCIFTNPYFIIQKFSSVAMGKKFYQYIKRYWVKILLIRNDNIGDLVCSTPCFEACKKKYPNAQVDIIVNSLNAPVIIGNDGKNPYLDKIYIYTKTKHKKGIFAKIKALFHKSWILFCIFKQHYDVVVILRTEPSKYSALFAKCARGQICYGVGNQGNSKTAGIPNFCPVPINSIHEVMVCFDILAPLGIEYTGEKTAYAYPHAFKPPASNPYILFHISSRRLKNNPYPLESLLEIIQNLSYFWIVIGDKEDKPKCEILAKLPNCQYKNTQTLDEVAALARGALLTLAFEGGIAHIFGACNAKAITIFDKVEIPRWGTWGHFESCLQAKSKKASDVKPQIIIQKIIEMIAQPISS